MTEEERKAVIMECITMMALVIAVLGALPASVWLTGQTFGQQCAKAYPKDQREKQRCVYEMKQGLRKYPLDEARP